MQKSNNEDIQKRINQGVKHSEIYQTMIQHSVFGYALFQVDYDHNLGTDCLTYVEVNESFEKLIGSKASELIGKGLYASLPGTLITDDTWKLIMKTIIEKKDNLDFKHYIEPLHRWFQIKVMHFEEKLIAIQIHDITPELEQLVRYENFFHVDIDMLCVGDKQGKLLKVSNEWQNALGYLPGEIENRYFMEFVHPEDQDATAKAVQLMNNEKDTVKLINRFRAKDGSYHYIEWKAKPQGEYIYAAARDITERKEGEEALRISEAKYRLLTETTSDVIWVVKMPETIITYISPTVYPLTGYTVEEIMNGKLEEFVSADTYQSLIEKINKLLEEFDRNKDMTQNIIIETQLICKDGRRIWTEASASLRYNQKHEIEMVGVSRNIESRKKYEKEVLYLSYHDQLTGLYNRRFYEEELKNINNEMNYPISLVMADVNGLKLTNDAFGHALGDKLLITFADILKQECRSGDIIARIGGDEFVLLLPRTNTIQTEKIVDRIRKILRKTMIEKVMLSVSFGWKTKYTPEEEFENIYKAAEDAMYRNKLWDGESYKSDTIKMITKSLFEKSPGEQLHSERTSVICKKLGSAMELDENGINELGLVGLLHDIGKIGISEAVLNKTDHLTEAEQEELKRHSEIGYHILKSVNEFTDIAEYVLAHHEQCNGSGYPKGLKEEDIPFQARILLVADAYDEMTGSFAFQRKYTPREALEELRSNVGVRFDHKIVEIFAEKVFPELI